MVEEALRCDLALGAQGAVSLPAIQRYVDRLLAGENPPSIKMDGDVIVDGNHRYIASRLLGRDVQVTAGVLPSSMKGNVKLVSQIKVDYTDWGNELLSLCIRPVRYWN